MSKFDAPDPIATSVHADLMSEKGKSDPQLMARIAEGIADLLERYPKPPQDQFFITLAEEDNFNGTLHYETFLGTLLDDTHCGPRWPLQHSDIKVKVDPTFLFVKLTFATIY